MSATLFLVADLWLIFACFFGAWRFIRHYGNHLLGLEWLIVGTSAVNFLVWSLFVGDQSSPLYWLAGFLDAFSRSVGFTLILVMGLMRVTHRYRPRPAVEIGVFALAVVAGLYLQQFLGHGLHVGPATFYVVVNLLTTGFLAYVTWRLWGIGAKNLAVWTAVVTAAATVIALTYDFFPIPGDDEQHTLFYIAALATWGTQAFVYLHAYRALHDHNVATGLESGRKESFRAT